MEPPGERAGQGDRVRITAQMLKALSGEFSLESILLLKLCGLGLVDLGCLGECLGLEWLDLSRNILTHLGPLASLRQLAVLNVSANRLTGIEPLASCESLQSLNVAGNLLAGVGQLQCLAGLQRLEHLRLQDPLARLSNPLCSSSSYRAAVWELLPGLKVIDGERVSGKGSEFYQLCRDLDKSLHRSPGPVLELPGEAKPWVEPSYWKSPQGQENSILEDACRQFQDTVQEFQELSQKADDTLAQAEEALRPASGNTTSFVF
ncbi:leucine-rich repeat-containing protein 61 [Gracilinanus agilis]|uniref:leucine-rich repeat-containing protein 61 n=1 Tax=Gracilinanus agilis TaxID=191870 RepID=UPI001CFD38C0|nr:leucine-rich repeat-containing protein 61 [Gracilinanus agilis]XP_044535403.1 leucine-rich repeat-containing protein 61 [Gracilinanus agilis]XP_044535404.1 leucine-rich repeat-containing protein 61 [Gracilinanus agilis]XP_044535405.1 leucine-rich repeat-containing protein 61 [Gracilinanus agilis]